MPQNAAPCVTEAPPRHIEKRAYAPWESAANGHALERVCGFRGKSATDSDLKSATDSDLKPATRSEASRPLIPI